MSEFISILRKRKADYEAQAVACTARAEEIGALIREAEDGRTAIAKSLRRPTLVATTEDAADAS
jgi:hypothetical protein